MRFLRVVVRLFAAVGFLTAVLLVGWAIIVGRMKAVYVREGGTVVQGWWRA